MSTLQERIKEALTDVGASKTDLWKACGLTSGTVSQWVNGPTQTIKGPNLLKAASFLRVNPEWLASGKGKKKSEASDENTRIGPELKGRCPLISWVRAGEMCEAVDPFQPGDADEWYFCPVKHGPHTYVLEVIGESMDTGDASGYREGEHIYVDPEQQPRHGDDVIVRTPDGKATFKRLQVTPDGSFLLALNPNWPNRIIKVEEGTVICGKVIYSGKPRG